MTAAKRSGPVPIRKAVKTMQKKFNAGEVDISEIFVDVPIVPGKPGTKPNGKSNGKK